MTAFATKISQGSDVFGSNREAMLALVERLRAYEQRAVDTSNKRRPAFEKRGQIPPHERISRLLDPGMPFLRLHTMGNFLVEDDNPETSVPGGNIIAGIGFVSGIRSLVWVDDSGIAAGSMTKMSANIVRSIQEIALRQKLPLIHLVESGGADLMNYAIETWAEGGQLFRNLSRLSAAGIPTIAVLHGPSTAGGAYMTGLSDYVIGVRNNGLAALAGAALVQAATGEIANDRELGGSEMHASISGLVEYLAEDDGHAIAIARDLVAGLDWNRHLTPMPRRAAVPPVYAQDELAGVVPVDYKVSYDVRELVARIVDGSEFEEFKPRFGPATVCLQASLMGHAIGIIGNNGPIDPQGAAKATQFLQLCDQADKPVVFLHNTTGYIVGTASEQAGMVKHGSKMVQAVSNITVPKLSLYVGASFGAGNYGMCGYGFAPDFLFAWPNAATNVMSGESAAQTLRLVAQSIAKRQGRDVDEAMLAEQKDRIESHFARQESAFYTSGRILDHGIIDPRDTRKVLGFCLDTCREARNRRVRPNSFGVARI